MVGGINGGSSFDPAQMAQNIFKKMDSDESGSISKSEFLEFEKSKRKQKSDATGSTDNTDETERVNKMFSEIDTDGDGEISEAENEEFVKTRRPPPPEKAFPMDMMQSMIGSMEQSSSSSDSQNILSILSKAGSGETLNEEDKSTLNSFAQQLSTKYGFSFANNDENWKGMFINYTSQA